MPTETTIRRWLAMFNLHSTLEGKICRYGWICSACQFYGFTCDSCLTA